MSSIETVCRITNQAGADVYVLKAPDFSPYDHGWKCAGCGQGADPADIGSSLRVDDAQKSAVRHADACRFQPA